MSSTPMKTVSGVGYMAGSLKFLSESPFKRPARVAFVINEEEEPMCGVNQFGKKRKSNIDGEGNRIATSTGELTIEIGLSEIVEMIGQGLPTVRHNVSMFVNQ